ncbi:Dienelactone hydrolase and related enzyme [Rhodospirillaceae bacterium LM-1]|nr:Dienelactone hydrolase and related enzyme [Rhodospirillaceae bacterium LM-1]
MRFLASLLFITLILAGQCAVAGLIEEQVDLSVHISGEALSLQALIVRPGDDRPRPLAVINHGAPRKADARAEMSPRTYLAQAREFAQRGWVTVMFMRRGYGESEGDYVESTGKCDAPDYEKSGRASADDVRAVIKAMRKKPYVDGSKVISVGQSAGGFATVALTADPPPGLVGAISFAGGRGSAKPDEVCTPERLIKAFKTFGEDSRIPMLWVYAENDHFFSPALAKRFHQAFVSAGGQARFIEASAFGADGHSLFSAKGAPIWTRYLDDYLQEQKLTAALPPPSSVKRSVRYPDGLGAKGKEAFLKYLDGSDNKAFVMASDGSFGWRTGRSDIDTAIEEATEFCQENTRKRCDAVMINNDPVE